jgi:hypothetical protein
MARRFLTILTGRNLPKIQQAREPEPPIVNERPSRVYARSGADGSSGARARIGKAPCHDGSRVPMPIKYAGR